MRYAVRVLARPELAAGFALAGMPTVEAEGDAQPRERLHELMSDPQVGVVLVEEGFYDHLPDDWRRDLGRRPLPMVVPIPKPAWTEQADQADAYIIELLRQVIGYRVRLK